MITTINVELKPNAKMRDYLQQHCDYRRYCWNQALSLWNDWYDAYCLKLVDTKPNANAVRNHLVQTKSPWQYRYSARTLQLAVLDLKHAFNAFFDKQRLHSKHPKFISKKRPKQSFKTDRAKVINGCLRLDRPRDFDKTQFDDIPMHGYRELNGTLVMTNIKMVNQRMMATLFIKGDENQITTYTNQKTAIDVNVSHFNYTDGTLNVLPVKIERLYLQNKYYQRQLANKRNAHPYHFKASKSYQAYQAKLQRNYRTITNWQNNNFHQFTHMLVQRYDQIVIEDLDVHRMMMSKTASKGMQRSSFSKFRAIITYKCAKYGKHLIVANRYYPSTQLCSHCGHCKTGDEKITLQGNAKHHTKHPEYICYQCGYVGDRDENAVQNLLKLAQ